MKSVDIKTVHVAGTNLFTTCSKLTEVRLANLSTIPDSMFSSCSKLITIDIPETVTSFGAYAFSNSGLTSITMPDSVKSIGTNCFLGCTALGDIICLSTTAPSLGTDSFGNNSTNYTGSKAITKNLYIPSNATGYESGDWKKVLSDIVGFTFNYTL